MELLCCSTHLPACPPIYPLNLSIKHRITTAEVLISVQAGEPPRFGAVLPSTVK